MKWLSNYEKELDLAFSEAESILYQLPVPFSKQAVDYLDKFHALKEHRSKNYICYLLPFWLQSYAGIDRETCRRIAVANLFKMMYFHLVDACMDDPDTDVSQQLTLAEFIHIEFISAYQECLKDRAPFWVYYKKYVSEWAAAVSTEKVADFYYENPVRLGHKAAPVKLSVAASMILGGREQEIEMFESAVDTALVTLQLLDDWEDWEKDLEQGSYNSLVSVVQAQLNLPSGTRPSPEEIRDGMMVHDALSELSALANRNHESLAAIKNLAPDLYHFHHDLVRNLNEGAQEVISNRNQLLNGGLEYWLVKNS